MGSSDSHFAVSQGRRTEFPATHWTVVLAYSNGRIVTNDLQTNFVKWSIGYRLPTEAVYRAQEFLGNGGVTGRTQGHWVVRKQVGP